MKKLLIVLAFATSALAQTQPKTIALKAARRTVRVWPFSDYAPDAQYLVGRCFEEKQQDENAFKEYQAWAERQSGHKIKEIRTDRGKEYMVR